MKCDCADCGLRGMELCEHRKLMDAVNSHRKVIKSLMSALEEAIEYFDRTQDCNCKNCSDERMKQCTAYGGGCYMRGEWGNVLNEAGRILWSE